MARDDYLSRRSTQGKVTDLVFSPDPFRVMSDLTPVLTRVRDLLQPYAKHFTMRDEGGMNCGLYSEKKIEAFGRQYEEMFFAGARMNKGAVGFYFMPIYTHEKEFVLSPKLKKLLKGKSCFHLKKDDPEIVKELESLLKQGYECYKKAGWV